MKVYASVAFVFFGLSCGGGSSTPSIPQAQACTQAAQAACAKVFSCTNDPVLMGAQFLLGGSEPACRTAVQQMYCSAFQCGAGQTYHGDKAAACKAQFGSVTCQALSAAAALAAGAGGIEGFLAGLPGCNEICTGGSSDAGSGG
ncbi:MAG: hypothetical protein H7X95_08830 [Deltaproteobacteria bacterium]|nr:hypothetical protein [Deltaproteobacteria bacterium]